jgi:hypothetical protein
VTIVITYWCYNSHNLNWGMAFMCIVIVLFSICNKSD